MSYRPLFHPTDDSVVFDPSRAYRLGDRDPAPHPVGTRPADTYEYDDRITLAVNVALAAGRPLLVRGLPGTGKSSLARSVATRLGWRYHAATMSSRSTARDLLWTFDNVARLSDAQAGQLRGRDAYLTPGPLWWAFDPASARARSGPDATRISPDADPDAGERAVVLIDEIDKADPDVPNDLLVPLGAFRFDPDTGPPVVARAVPLVVITSNDERDLPPAFLRRCVVLVLEEPDPERLRRIAERHFPDLSTEPVFDAVLQEYARIRGQRDGTTRPSIAELLDALAACEALRTGPHHADWAGIAGLVLAKATGPLGAS
jgi:MoxR-like ATPase